MKTRGLDMTGEGIEYGKLQEGDLSAVLPLCGWKGCFLGTAAFLLWRCFVHKGLAACMICGPALAVLLLAALEDQEKGQIPDKLNLALFFLGLLSLYDRAGPSSEDRILGFFCVSLVFLAVSAVSGGGIGGGDVKLMAAAGFLTGAGKTIPAACLGLGLAGVYGSLLLLSGRGGRKTSFPLGPFLCLGVGWFLGV